jgi:hypothetical protein
VGDEGHTPWNSTEAAGIVTDRDIVVRAIAEGREPQATTVGDVCTSGAHTLEPGDSVEAAQAIGDSGIRNPALAGGQRRSAGRHPVAGRPGQDRDAGPPFAEISAASPNR